MGERERLLKMAAGMPRGLKRAIVNLLDAVDNACELCAEPSHITQAVETVLIAGEPKRVCGDCAAYVRKTEGRK